MVQNSLRHYQDANDENTALHTTRELSGEAEVVLDARILRPPDQFGFDALSGL